MPTSLTLYGTNGASSTLGTAEGAVASTGASGNVVAGTVIGTSTGYSEIYSSGSSNTWAGAGSLGSPSGHGFLYDSTALEGQNIIAGNWQPIFRFNVNAGSVVADLIIRAYKRSSGGTYTAIGTCTYSAQTLTTTFTTFTFPNTSLPAMAFTTGDKLYYDVWVFVGVGNNSTGSGTAKLQINTSNSASQGRTSNAELITPGYQPAIDTLSLAGRFLLQLPIQPDLKGRFNLTGSVFKDQAGRFNLRETLRPDLKGRFNLNSGGKRNPYGMTHGLNPGKAFPVTQRLSQQVVNWAVSIGMTRFRFQFPADHIWINQSDPASAWGWAPLDDAIYKITSAGLYVVYTLQGMPAFATANPLFQATDEPWYMPDPNFVLTFALAVAARYNGKFNIPGYGPMKINAYEIGNEEYNIHFTAPYPARSSVLYHGLRTSPYYEYNGVGGIYSSASPISPQPGRDPYYFRQVLQVVAPALRAAVPSGVEIGGAAAWWLWDDNYHDFVAGLGTDISLLDYLTFHFYTKTNDPINPQSSGAGLHIPGAATVYAKMRQATTEAGYPNLAIDVTEFGWDIIDVPDEATQASNFQNVYDVWRTSGIRRAYMYTIDDGTPISEKGSVVQYDPTTGTYHFRQAWTTILNYIATWPQWNATAHVGNDLVGRFNLSDPAKSFSGRFNLQIPPVVTPLDISKLPKYQPLDGYAIFEAIAPTLTATYPARLQAFASGGFKLVLNESNLLCSGSQLVAYINAAAALGLKVIVSLSAQNLWDGTPDISGSYPAMCASAGSTTGAGVVAYVANLVKTLSGVWGYCVGESVASSNHAALKTHADLIHTNDSSHPRLYLDNVLDAVSFAQANSPFYDCCDVGGSEHYPTGSYATDAMDNSATYAATVAAQATAHGFSPAFACQSFTWSVYSPARCAPFPGCAPFPSRYQMRRQLDLVESHMQPRLILWSSYGDILSSDEPASNWDDLVYAITGRHVCDS